MSALEDTHHEKKSTFVEDETDEFNSIKDFYGKGAGRSNGKAPAVASGAGGNNHSKIQLVHLEDVQSKDVKPTRVKKFRQHIVRFWLCYAIAGFILLAVGLPVLFLEIVPAIAQLIVNKTSLPIYQVDLKAVSNNAVQISMDTALTVPGGLTVKLDPVDLFLYNKDSPGFNPYTHVPLGAQKLKGHTAINITDQTVGIGNRTELTKWLKKTLYGKKTQVSVRGNTTAHLGALHFKVNVKKTVTINALRELEGFALESSTLVLPAEKDGTNLVGTVMLPNWSDLNIGLGNVTLNAYFGSARIGLIAVNNVYLPKGNSTFPFRAQIFIQEVIKNIPEILQSQSQALTQGQLSIIASGNSTIYNGEHIKYLETVLNPARIAGQIPITQLLTDILSSISSGKLKLGSLLDEVTKDLGPSLKNIFGSKATDNLHGLLENTLQAFNGTSANSSNSSGSNFLDDILGGFNVSRRYLMDEVEHRVRRSLEESAYENMN